MTSDTSQAKHPVSAALAGPYGHPFHPIAVTVPIGAWVASLIFDVGSHGVADPAMLAVGSRWLIGIGVAGALVAAMIGLLDLFAIPTGTPAFRLGLVHMTLNLIVTASYAGEFAWRQASAATPGPVSVTVVVWSAATLAVLAVAGFLGGKLAFRYGVRVADEATQAEGFHPARQQRA